jgi:hypothetical protein
MVRSLVEWSGFWLDDQVLVDGQAFGWIWMEVRSLVGWSGFGWMIRFF